MIPDPATVDNAFAVIMAGGSGTRFWPASSPCLPKQFLRVAGERTLFEETLARVGPLVPDERVFAVINQAHERLTAESLRGRAVSILCEPAGRNTAACIGLAAVHISRVSPGDPIVVLPADHFIRDVDAFRRTLISAIGIARSGAIVTIGVSPDRPETGFGYIEVGGSAGENAGNEFLEVKRFVEKPNRDAALRYLASGRCLWNSGIFIFTARTILAEIERLAPELHGGLVRIAGSIGTPEYARVLSDVYQGLDSISIDYAVMEKTESPVYALRCDFGWSDVGSWQAVHELHQRDADDGGNVLLGRGIALDAANNLLYSTTDRPVAFLGVEGLAIVDTPDGILVTRLDRSQDVKRVPEMVKHLLEER